MISDDKGDDQIRHDRIIDAGISDAWISDAWISDGVTGDDQPPVTVTVWTRSSVTSFPASPRRASAASSCGRSPARRPVCGRVLHPLRICAAPL